MCSEKKINILICYENNCGGETVATEAIINASKDISGVYIRYTSLNSPTFEKNSILFWLSTFFSIFTWVKIILTSNSLNWIYTTTFSAGVAASILKIFFQYKIAWHFHGNRIPPKANNLKGKNLFSQTIKYHGIRLLHLFFINSLDQIFVPSTYSKNYLEKNFNNIKKNIAIIPNGVDTSIFKPILNSQKKLIKISLNIATNLRILLYVGRLEQQKNVHRLIKYFYLLQKSDHNALLIIAFPTPNNKAEQNYCAYLYKLINLLDLSTKVFFLENYEKLTELYNIADLVISLSKTENFPLTILESWACKSLFASTPVGIVPTLFYQKNKDFILNNSDNINDIVFQIKKLLSYPTQLKKKVILKNFQESKKYNWNKSSRLIFKALLSH